MKLKYILLFFLFGGCTFTSSKTKDPSFKTDQNTIAGYLTNTIDCERIDITGTEENTNGNKISELTIKIINGVNLPSQKAELELLGKKITFKLIENLTDPDEFDTFKLFFVTQQENGALKTNQYEGFVYKLAPPVKP